MRFAIKVFNSKTIQKNFKFTIYFAMLYYNIRENVVMSNLILTAFNSINLDFQRRFGEAYTRDFVESQLKAILKWVFNYGNLQTVSLADYPIDLSPNSIVDICAGVSSLRIDTFNKQVDPYDYTVELEKYINSSTTCYDYDITGKTKYIKISDSFIYEWSKDKISIKDFIESYSNYLENDSFKSFKYKDYLVHCLRTAAIHLSYYPLEITNFRFQHNLKGLYLILLKRIYKWSGENKLFFLRNISTFHLRNILEEEFYWRAFLAYINFSKEDLIENNSIPKYKKAKIFYDVKQSKLLGIWEYNNYFSIEDIIGDLTKVITFKRSSDISQTLDLINSNFSERINNGQVKVLEIKMPKDLSHSCKHFYSYLNKIVNKSSTTKSDDDFPLFFANRRLKDKRNRTEEIQKTIYNQNEKLTLFKVRKNTKRIYKSIEDLMTRIDNLILIQNFKNKFDPKWRTLYIKLLEFKNICDEYKTKSVDKLDDVQTQNSDSYIDRNVKMTLSLVNINTEIMDYMK